MNHDYYYFLEQCMMFGKVLQHYRDENVDSLKLECSPTMCVLDTMLQE